MQNNLELKHYKLFKYLKHFYIVLNVIILYSAIDIMLKKTDVNSFLS